MSESSGVGSTAKRTRHISSASHVADRGDERFEDCEAGARVHERDTQMHPTSQRGEHAIELAGLAQCVASPALQLVKIGALRVRYESKADDVRIGGAGNLEIGLRLQQA